MIRSFARRYHRAITLAFLASLLLSVAGCTTAWTQEASSIISLLVPAIQAILGILSAFGIGLSPDVMTAVDSWANQAESALVQVKSLIDQYTAAEASAQPGILVEIQTALKVVSDNLATLLPTIHITDPATQAKIEAVVTAVANEVAALITLIPAVQGKVTSAAEFKRLVESSGLMDAKQFKEDFNTKLEAFGPEAEAFKLQ